MEIHDYTDLTGWNLNQVSSKRSETQDMLVHISNNYPYSTVHSCLANSLVEKGVEHQFVYSPLQRKTEANPAVQSHSSIKVASPRIFNKFIRYLPLTKVLFSFLCFLWSLQKHNIKPTFIIAHNLWSDGMVAWLYHKLTGVRYTVAVRDSDINFFLPKLRPYHWLIRRVSRDAKRIIFINNAYVDRLKENYSHIPVEKAQVIYNGIIEDWLHLEVSPENDSSENDSSEKVSSEKNRPNNVCFVGAFIKRKNLKNTIQALSELKKTVPDLTFTAIGGTEQEFLKCTGLTAKPNWITIVPRTGDRELIARHLRRARVFLMPSFTETFGLVYIEALSQGCSLIHSKNEGIDGVFEERFVQRVDPHDVDDIRQKVALLISNYPSGVPNAEIDRLIGNFSWEYIAEQYLEIITEEKLEWVNHMRS